MSYPCMIILENEKIVLRVIVSKKDNKAGYTATEVACGWAGAIFEVPKPFGQEQ